MLEKIKSNYLRKNVLDYINKKRVLNIFKYSKFYQSKFGFNKCDYLIQLFDNISFNLNDPIFIEKEPDIKNTEYLFNFLKKEFPHDISNDLLKECIIKYFCIRNDLILSINHIYFTEIIKEKILQGQNNLKIKFDFAECLSQNNIIDLIKPNNSNEIIINHINDRIKFNNNLIQKLQLLLNSNICIKELYFNLTKDGDISTCSIDYQKDIIEYKENEIEDEKNILINFKLKRGELINKIIEKNCRNIINMNYLVFDKISIKNNNQIFPLIELNKFENLIFLDLDVLYNGDFDDEIIFNFTNKLNKLKNFKINGYQIYDGYDVGLNLYIQKETLNQLETLKIKNMNWIVKKNESFNFKNIKKLHIKNCFLPEIYNNEKKYFFKEMLKGDINWEKLEKMEISLTFDIIEYIKEEYKNKEIIHFLKVAKERENEYEPTSEFYPNFFNFIFNNQNMYIKTNKNNKNIEEFKIKIYDNNKCGTCHIDTIIYEKRGKNVNITMGRRLYGIPVINYFGLQESPLKYINLDNIIIDPFLDSFTIDHHTINELKEIKNFISEQHKKIKNFKTYYDDIKNKIHYYTKNLEIKLNELKLKEDLLRNERNIILKDLDKKSYFEKTISKIKEITLIEEIGQLKELNKKLSCLSNMSKKAKKNKIQNYNEEDDDDKKMDDLGDLFND